MAIGECGQGRHFADQTVSLILPRFDVEDFFRLGIKSRKRPHRADQHAHGMGLMMKTIDDFLYVLMNNGMIRNIVGPVLEL
jgi:hypothetical protein